LVVFTEKPQISNIHAGFHVFALWWYLTFGSIGCQPPYTSFESS
jgi:hypothetical protein